MSCEQLVTKLQSRQVGLPEKTRERVKVSYFIQFLSNTCRTGRPRLTHTSKIANAVKDAEMDQIWEKNQQEAQEYLDSLQ